MKHLPMEFCPGCDGWADDCMLMDEDGSSLTCYACGNSYTVPEQAESASGRCEYCHDPSDSFVCEGCVQGATAYYTEQAEHFAAKERQVKAARYQMTPAQFKRYLKIETDDRRYWEYKLSRVRGEFYELFLNGVFEQVTVNGKAVTRSMQKPGYKVRVRKQNRVMSPMLTRAQWFKHLTNPII